MKKAHLVALTGSLVLALTTLPLAAQETPQHPWLDKSLAVEKRVDLLLAQMTTDEKVALLHGPMAVAFVPGMKMPEGAIGSAGYVPGNTRLGIPALQESDASLGVANPMMVRGAADMSTPLPSSLALAATFNPDIAFAGGQMVGAEARAKGINVMLAGGANLARDPRNGRNFEYVGEDPLLAGTMAGESVRGIQSMGVVSTVKHYALNDQEHNRMTADSIIGEGAARESDLFAFQIAIERGKPGSVMCAYNLINGQYGCESKWLLNDVLKRDWGYAGFVMSDWGAVHSLDALTNGLDQQSGEQLDKQVWFDKPLKEGLASGKIAPARLDDAARRILRAMFAHGLFDNPPAPGGAIDFTAHAAIAQREAEEGIVLLKNRESLLPLASSVKRIAVIGGHADAGVAAGGGSSQVANPWRPQGVQVRSLALGGEGMMGAFNNVLFHPSSPLAAIRSHFKEAQVSFDTGAYPSAAAAAAKAADVAILFVYQPSTEGFDVADMSLPFGQDALVEAVTTANPNTILVLQTGNAVHMPWADKAGAVLQAWYSGAKGGEAIARVIAGEVNPSGRLPVSWPVDESQLPRPVIPGTGAAADARVTVDYNIEGADVGYRWYARKATTPRYWFGYGLSYTNFAYSDLQVAAKKDISAQVTVANSGARAGQVVVQLFLSGGPADIGKRLLAFQKVALQPGESKRVTLAIDPRLLARFDEAGHQWRIAKGTYNLAIGSDAGTPILTGSATLPASTLKP
jgi:beta-glucosidase